MRILRGETTLQDEVSGDRPIVCDSETIMETWCKNLGVGITRQQDHEGEVGVEECEEIDADECDNRYPARPMRTALKSVRRALRRTRVEDEKRAV